RPSLIADMLRKGRSRKAERAGFDGLAVQRGDFFDLAGMRFTLHRLFAHHEMAKRRERREKREIDSRSSPRGRIQVLWKGLPLPGDSARERIEGDRLDVHEVPRRYFAYRFAAWRDADAAIAHHYRGDSVPRRAADQRIPADLRIV